MFRKIEECQFMQFFSVLPDPRKLRNQLHSLSDIISTAILAILCGYDDWEDVSLWTQAQLPWLQSFGICKGFVPHQTPHTYLSDGHE
ncbi:MAG: transposase family protein [Rhabdochlamydiaceae bacterium]